MSHVFESSTNSAGSIVGRRAALVGINQEAPRGGESQTLLPALYFVSEHRLLSLASLRQHHEETCAQLAET